ncbi:MAG: prepilin-type N-terminal cleavage/methylation domain-containing protein [Gallionella sp.]
MKRNQSGFTLIEIAIVLVIIGLLLGGVLKGQELINSAKVKNLAGDFKNIPVAIYGYQDKYKATPGDDLLAVSHLSGASGVDAGGGNGLIDGNWNSTTATDESFNFWQQIRLAGFGPGSTDKSSPEYIPQNAVGGTLGVTNVSSSPISGMKGTYVICSGSIAGKFAKQIDLTLDDSNTATGTIMVNSNTSGTPSVALATGSVTDDATYTVCLGF